MNAPSLRRKAAVILAASLAGWGCVGLLGFLGWLFLIAAGVLLEDCGVAW